MSIDIYMIMCYTRSMFDNIIYRTLDTIVNWCERYRSYRMNKHIPKHNPNQLKKWVKQQERQKKSYK